MSIRKPNFFIIGAPKCGTTSLAAWLGEHPQICVSVPKEPNYFNTDHDRVTVYDLEQYESLFRDAGACHAAIGEATVWYLYSKVAIENILEYNASARFIVCLRNPIEMAAALHRQKIFSGYEHILDFERAWHLSEQRLQGRNVKPWSKDCTQLSYKNACLLGEQVGRLLSRVPRERVHFVLLEDVADDPRGEYLKILDFLALEDNGRNDFVPLNIAKERRWPRLAQLVTLAAFAKRQVGLRVGLGIANYITPLNVKERSSGAIRQEFRAQLRSYFSDDVQKLNDLLGRDLRHWLQ